MHENLFQEIVDAFDGDVSVAATLLAVDKRSLQRWLDAATKPNRQTLVVAELLRSGLADKTNGVAFKSLLLRAGRSGGLGVVFNELLSNWMSSA